MLAGCLLLKASRSDCQDFPVEVLCKCCSVFAIRNAVVDAVADIDALERGVSPLRASEGASSVAEAAKASTMKNRFEEKCCFRYLRIVVAAVDDEAARNNSVDMVVNNKLFSLLVHS